jgi:hypothetical protein
MMKRSVAVLGFLLVFAVSAFAQNNGFNVYGPDEWLPDTVFVSAMADTSKGSVSVLVSIMSYQNNKTEPALAETWVCGSFAETCQNYRTFEVRLSPGSYLLEGRIVYADGTEARMERTIIIPESMPSPPPAMN